MSEEDPGIVEPRHVYWYDGRWRDANRGPPWYASMADVRVALHPAPADPEAPFVERVWGPVNSEVAQLCGALAAAASVLLRVHVSEQILAEVEKLIPEQIRCRPGLQGTQCRAFRNESKNADGWIQVASKKEGVVRVTWR